MKQSELLRKQADMMDMAEKYGIDDWRKLVKVKDFSDEYWFALAVVEGKPVFEGDELWCNFGKHRFKVKGLANNGVAFEYATRCNGRVCTLIDSASWNPPKPKTVMVELLRDDAESVVKFSESIHLTMLGRKFDGIAAACRKALEQS